MAKMQAELDATKSKTEKLDEVTGKSEAIAHDAILAIHHLTSGKLSNSWIHKGLEECYQFLKEDRVNAAEAARRDGRAASHIKREAEEGGGHN